MCGAVRPAALEVTLAADVVIERTGEGEVGREQGFDERAVFALVGGEASLHDGGVIGESGDGSPWRVRGGIGESGA